MWQVLFTIPIFGGVKVFGYGMMLFLAFLASMNVAAFCAKKSGLNPEVIYDLSLGVFLGGLIGARLFYVAQYWGTKIHGVGEIFQIWKGGVVLYGSIIGGAFAFFIYRGLKPFPLRPALDAIAPAIALGIAIGRFGCFLNGCCFGDVCGLPWAVSFPEPSPPWMAHNDAHLLNAGQAWSLPVHPTQIYSVIDGLLLMNLLLAYYPLRKRDGEVMGLLMVTYPFTRFLIEYLRSDELAVFAGMTISQNISVALFLSGLAFWVVLSRLPGTRFAGLNERPMPAAAR